MPVTIADAEFYIVRPEAAPGEWAYITLDEQTGCFMAHGSFGTFAYVWHNRGPRSLKTFLAGLSYDYFFGKTAASRGEVFCAEKTLAAIRSHVLESRRDGSVGPLTARAAWDDLAMIDAVGQVTFFDMLTGSDEVMKILDGDYYDLARTRPDPQCVGFWEAIWPAFLAEIAPAPAPESVAA